MAHPRTTALGTPDTAAPTRMHKLRAMLHGAQQRQAALAAARQAQQLQHRTLPGMPAVPPVHGAHCACRTCNRG